MANWIPGTLTNTVFFAMTLDYNIYSNKKFRLEDLPQAKKGQLTGVHSQLFLKFWIV